MCMSWYGEGCPCILVKLQLLHKSIACIQLAEIKSWEWKGKFTKLWWIIVRCDNFIWWDAKSGSFKWQGSPSNMSLIMSMWPSTALPTRHVKPTIVPFLFRIAEILWSVPCTPALLSPPKSPTAASAAARSLQSIYTKFLHSLLRFQYDHHYSLQPLNMKVLLCGIAMLSTKGQEKRLNC